MEILVASVLRGTRASTADQSLSIPGLSTYTRMIPFPVCVMGRRRRPNVSRKGRWPRSWGFPNARILEFTLDRQGKRGYEYRLREIDEDGEEYSKAHFVWARSPLHARVQIAKITDMEILTITPIEPCNDCGLVLCTC